MMLRLYVPLNVLLLKAFSAQRMIVSSRGTLVKNEGRYVIQHDNIEKFLAEKNLTYQSPKCNSILLT